MHLNFSVTASTGQRCRWAAVATRSASSCRRCILAAERLLKLGVADFDLQAWMVAEVKLQGGPAGGVSPKALRSHQAVCGQAASDFLLMQGDILAPHLTGVVFWRLNAERSAVPWSGLLHLVREIR